MTTQNMDTPIPLQKPMIGDEELEEIRKVLASGWLGLGAKVKEFEDGLKTYLGAKHVLCVNTGTTALHISLASLGIGPGDEVLLPSLTFVATPQAVLAAGATPVFCDVEDDTLNISVADIQKKVTPRTKAIIPVHYCGTPCDMDAILDLAKKHKLRVVEDAAHAFGSSYKGRKIGGIGDITCFSFDPIKTITSGEGGAVVSSDDAFIEKVRLKRILGIEKETWRRYNEKREWFYDVSEVGYRYHMSNINAAIGVVQLTRADHFVKRKLEIVRRYDEAFCGIAGLRLLKRNYEDTAYFMYIVRVQERERFMKYLKEAGVENGVHYQPSHTFSLFAKSKVSLPITEKAGEEIVTLPLGPQLTDTQVDRVITTVRAFYSAS